MDHDQLKRRLTPLRDEARALAERSSVTREQVDDWRKRAASLLVEVYGRDSEAVRNFSRIRFDYADVVDATDLAHKEKAAELNIDISGLKIQLPSGQKALR